MDNINMTDFAVQAIDQSRLTQYLQNHQISNSFNLYLTLQCRIGYLQIQQMTRSEISEEIVKINAQTAKLKKNSGDIQLSGAPAWRKGQFKLFVWFLTFYSFTKNVQIEALDQSDFQLFSSIFIAHSPLSIKYEVKCLLPPSQNSKVPWCLEEEKFIKRLMESPKSKGKRVQWKVISAELFRVSSGKYFRTCKECRERWVNHWDPELNKDEWTLEEELVLISMVHAQGNQWAKIAKRLKVKRTQHMVKNHYKSLIRKWKARFIKLTISSLEIKIIKSISLKLGEDPQAIIQRNVVIKKEVQTEDPNENHQVKEESISSEDENFISPHEITSQDYEPINQQGGGIPFLEPPVQQNCYPRENNVIEKVRLSDEQKEEVRNIRNDIIDKAGCYWDPLDVFFEDESVQREVFQLDSW